MLTAEKNVVQRRSWLERARTSSPLRRLDIHVGASKQTAWLKLEMYNPTGSIKYRTALSLIQALDEASPLTRGSTIIESTSGNLGLALTQLSAEIGCHYIAVVDPRLPRTTAEAMRAAGAEVIMVDRRDEHSGYLLERLRTVQELCAASLSMRWANQYDGRANPAVHRDVTGPEVVDQTGGQLDMVVVPVSTGGTLAGISEYVRRVAPSARIVAVDAAGSVATAGVSHAHLLTGIGATRPSSFLQTRHYDQVARVADIEAFAACRLLARQTGLMVGGSSGASVAAFLAETQRLAPAPRLPVLFCPDGGANYLDTIYSDKWLSSRGVLDAVNAIETTHEEKLRFELGEVTYSASA
jgi:cysteine synthase A